MEKGLRKKDNMKYIFKNTKIKGISCVCGNKKINIDDEICYYKSEKVLERLKKSIGFNTRYIVSDNITTFDLCKKATEILLEKSKLTPQDFDAIISVTQTPDYKMPGNAHLIHKAFGFAEDCIALDIELGCSGFIYGLFQAFLFAENSAKRILLLNGDTLSKIINIKNRTDAPIFGDCGCATIIEHTKEINTSYFLLKSDGSGYDLMIQKAGGAKYPCNSKTREPKIDKSGNEYCDEDFYMSGGDVFTFTLTKQPELLKELLDYSNTNKEDIDYFIFHQANTFIVDNIARTSELPNEKVLNETFKYYGNQSGASIPATICFESSKRSFKNKSLILQGYGIGLSWGGTKINLDEDVIICPMQIYNEGV